MERTQQQTYTMSDLKFFDLRSLSVNMKSKHLFTYGRYRLDCDAIAQGDHFHARCAVFDQRGTHLAEREFIGEPCKTESEAVERARAFGIRWVEAHT